MKASCFVLFLLLAGCAISPERRLALLHSGMTRQEVINLLGQPTSRTKNGSLEILNFVQFPKNPSQLNPHEAPRTSTYVIIGSDGRVESFGRNGSG